MNLQDVINHNRRIRVPGQTRKPDDLETGGGAEKELRTLNGRRPEASSGDATIAQARSRVPNGPPVSSLSTDEAKLNKTETRCFTIPGLPVAKPRMTQRDKWIKRPCVVAYRDYCDRLRLIVGNTFVPVALELHFEVPMPLSWSHSKRGQMEGEWCRTKPDLDNYIKAVLDGLWENDSSIAKITATKVWCEGGGSTSIEITP